ncbi:efflux transporter outer membrane subunit, partial [Variovorax paradoxus]|uniref:efflux transporter outer membrane subunit n=1 Tax=Variovorax paradoxus TaxID=34073 RepID=UPI000B0E2977
MKHASTSPFRPRVRSMLALACAALLAGCTVGPDFRRPDPPMAKDYAPSALPLDTVSAPVPGGDAQRFAPGRDIQADWWTLFGSPRLDALIARALARSPTLEAAQAALRAAQENVYAQRGFFYPTVGIGYSPARTKIAGNLGGNSPGVQGNGSVISTYQGTPASEGGSAPFNAPVIYNFHTAQLTVGYAPDIFGGQRRQLESLEAQARMQHYQLEATYLTLASNLVAASIQEALLRRQIAIAEGIVEANEQAVALLQRQLRAGYAARQDLAQQELALAQARQQLPPLRKQREQTRNLLRALAGDGPDEDLAIDFDLDALVLPRELPLALPSRLVEQRPDIRAAEEQLHAASAQVGVAACS